jgi:hypothetical protein
VLIGLDGPTLEPALDGLRSGAATFDADASDAPQALDGGDATVLVADVLATVNDAGVRMLYEVNTLVGLAEQGIADLTAADDFAGTSAQALARLLR